MWPEADFKGVFSNLAEQLNYFHSAKMTTANAGFQDVLHGTGVLGLCGEDMVEVRNLVFDGD